MANAVVRLDWYGNNASEPAGVTAETGFTFSRDNAQSGSTVVPKPTVTGTNYSFIKYLALNVTSGSSPTTAMTNRRVYLSGAPTTGLYEFWFNQATYTNPNSTQGTSAGNYPADTTASNGAVPGTPAYSALTATTLAGAHLWDNTSTNTNTTGRKGNFLQLVAGVGNNYAGDAGSVALPDLIAAYDEAAYIRPVDLFRSLTGRRELTDVETLV